MKLVLSNNKCAKAHLSATFKGARTTTLPFALELLATALLLFLLQFDGRHNRERDVPPLFFIRFRIRLHDSKV